MNTIILTNKFQVVLFKHELSGQLSDGFWASSRPLNHWEVPCRAKVVVGEEPRVTFYPSRKYNFNNKQLLDVVGDRMLTLCRFLVRYPKASDSVLSMVDSGEWWWSRTFTDQQTEYKTRYEGIKAELSSYGINTYTDLLHVLDSLSDAEYTMKCMRKDLKVINEAFKNIN